MGLLRPCINEPEVPSETFPAETIYICPVNPDRELMTDKTMNTTKIQFGEPMRFNGVTYRNMGDGLHIVEMIQRQLRHQSIPAWEPGTHYIPCRQLNMFKSGFSRCHSWCTPLVGSSPGFCLFQEPGLVLESLQLCSACSRGTLVLLSWQGGSQ